MLYVSRWCVWLACAAIISCLLTIPTPVWGQEISIAGIGEGSIVVLPPGQTATNLVVTATPLNPAGATNIIFTLERQGSIFLNHTSAPPYAIGLSNLTAGKYYLSARLAGPGTLPSGDVSFDIHPASLTPVNDNWSQATVLTGVVATGLSVNTDATGEPNEPTHSGSDAAKSVWWSWNAPSSGIFTVTTAGSSFDTVLAVYAGTNLSTLTELGANDDAGPNAFSQVTFTATNGTTYYFAADSASAAVSGQVQVKLLPDLPPAVVITSPLDGALFLVASATIVTNTQAVAAISDPAGIARVDYWFDGGSGTGRSGILSPPYQLSLTNLPAGHYLLTLVASNNLGLVSATNAGFSVISLAPVLVTEGFAYSNKFQLALTGFKGPNYSVQASKNLDAWCSVKTLTNFTGAEKVTDTNAAIVSQRFYRAASVP